MRLLGRELFLDFGWNVHDFEEGVRPSRTAAFLVLCTRSGREVTAVNGEATRSVLIPNEESLTQMHIRDDKSIELTTGLANLLSSLR